MERELCPFSAFGCLKILANLAVSGWTSTDSNDSRNSADSYFAAGDTLRSTTPLIGKYKEIVIDTINLSELLENEIQTEISKKETRVKELKKSLKELDKELFKSINNSIEEAHNRVRSIRNEEPSKKKPNEKLTLDQLDSLIKSKPSHLQDLDDAKIRVLEAEALNAQKAYMETISSVPGFTDRVTIAFRGIEGTQAYKLQQ